MSLIKHTLGYSNNATVIELVTFESNDVDNCFMDAMSRLHKVRRGQVQHGNNMHPTLSLTVPDTEQR